MPRAYVYQPCYAAPWPPRNVALRAPSRQNTRMGFAFSTVATSSSSCQPLCLSYCIKLSGDYEESHLRSFRRNRGVLSFFLWINYRGIPEIGATTHGFTLLTQKMKKKNYILGIFACFYFCTHKVKLKWYVHGRKKTEDRFLPGLWNYGRPLVISHVRLIAASSTWTAFPLAIRLPQSRPKVPMDKTSKAQI